MHLCTFFLSYCNKFLIGLPAINLTTLQSTLYTAAKTNLQNELSLKTFKGPNTLKLKAKTLHSLSLTYYFRNLLTLFHVPYTVIQPNQLFTIPRLCLPCSASLSFPWKIFASYQPIMKSFPILQLKKGILFAALPILLKVN